MKRFHTSVFLVLTALFCFCFAQTKAQTVPGAIMHDGEVRDYRLYVPSSATDASPLVFNFHGFTSDAFQQEFYSSMNAVADTAGFIVCYPNGLQNSWNVGWTFGSTADDVGFVSALIDSLSLDYSIDPDRIYACGMSNGGFMSYRLACELNDRIAAVASVTGSMAVGYTCEPGIPVPALEIHGTADNVVAYNGTANISIPIPDVLSFWATNNGCDAMPAEEDLPDTNTSDQSTVTKITYQNCTDGQEVLHFRINGGGHTWPGGLIDLPANGPTNRDIFASAEIWRFFDRFRLDDIVSSKEVALTPAFKLFPNPTTGSIQVNGFEPGWTFSIYNALGKIVHQAQAMNQPRVDLSHLPQGVYFIKVQGKEWQKTMKVIKK